MANAREAVALWPEALAADGRTMPPPRSLAAIRADPAVAPDVAACMAALVPFEARRLAASE